MNNTNKMATETKERKEKSNGWFVNFLLMGGWILVLIAVLAACGAIRTLLNY